MMNLPRKHDHVFGPNHLASFAWPGGYPIYYLMEDGRPICPDCANGKNGSEAHTGEPEGDGWAIVGADIYWEGPPMWCSHCVVEIESAYGEEYK